MVKVSTKFFVCKSCAAEGFVDNDDQNPRCPRCQNSLKTPTSQYYGTPNYLFLQRQSLLDKLERDNLIPGERTWNEKNAEIENHLTKWLRECPERDRIAAFEDTRMYLSNLLFTETSREGVAHIIKAAKAMGELAKTMEKYFTDGGSRYDREIRCVRAYDGDGGGSSEGATASWGDS